MLNEPSACLISTSVSAGFSALSRGPSVGFAATSPCFRMGRKMGADLHLPYREAMGEYPEGGRGPRGAAVRNRCAAAKSPLR
jgi:hypothetical protein